MVNITVIQRSALWGGPHYFFSIKGSWDQWWTGCKISAYCLANVITKYVHLGSKWYCFSPFKRDSNVITANVETESSLKCFTNPLWASVFSHGNGHKISTSSVIVRMKRNNFIYNTYMQILEGTIWNWHFCVLKSGQPLAISCLKWLLPVECH